MARADWRKRRHPRPLGRRRATDRRHLDAYPLSETPRGATIASAGVLGTDWYTSFDNPILKSNIYWIGLDLASLGSIRGGHAICAKSHDATDLSSWWDFYDQGREGACVGFAWSRVQTLNNRSRYAAPWLYHTAQLGDEYADTPPAEGTSVRAGGDVLVTQGHRKIYGTRTYDPDPAAGISTFRWAQTWDEVRAALALPDSYDGVALLNSWGGAYPHIVRMTDECGQLMLDRGGEFAIPTDR